MKLIGLSIQGLRKIKAAELDFDGKHLVEIRGRNGAGKSTVIDSMLYLFKGTKAIPEGVVTHGHSRGVIVGKVEGYTIRRVIDADGKSTLTVENEAGKVPSPQSFLDALAGQFLDPEYFSRLPSAEKRKVVMQYAGIDFAEIDAKIAKAEQDRTIIGRELKALGAIPPEPEKAEEVSVSALLEELNRLNEYNKKQDELADKIEDRVRFLRDMFVSALNSAVLTLEGLHEAVDGFNVEFVNCRGEMALLGVPKYAETEEVQSKIANAETINTKARAYQAYLDKKKAVEAKDAEYKAAGKTVEDLRQEKADMVKNAKLPLDGLEITDTGLAFKGNNDANWSDSETMKIAIRLAVAYSGDLKACYIKRGEALDSDSLARIKAFAEKEDFQIIVEIVDDSYAKDGEDVLYISDGEIVSPRKEQAE